MLFYLLSKQSIIMPDNFSVFSEVLSVFTSKYELYSFSNEEIIFPGSDERQLHSAYKKIRTINRFKISTKWGLIFSSSGAVNEVDTRAGEILGNI